jgi:hypothetical protein
MIAVLAYVVGPDRASVLQMNDISMGEQRRNQDQE